MNALLQSSLYGQDFLKYRKQHSLHERERFSNTVRTKGIGEIPVIVDSVDEVISKSLAGPDTTRYNRNGKEYTFHMELTIANVLEQVKQRVTLDDTKVFKVGLENGDMLNDKDILGDLYKKHKNPSDNILYLLLTQETTLFGYILSLLRSIFGQTFMKN